MKRASPLYLTAGYVHPTIGAQMSAYRALGESLGESPGWIRGMRSLESIDPAAVSLCIMYFHHPADEPEVVARLTEYVHAGGALLALHGASASFKGNVEYERLLGGVFTGHGRVCRMSMECGPDTAGSTMVVDEPYEHRISGDVDVICRWKCAAGGNIQAAAGVSSGEAAWTREFGDGRVGYFAPGHRRGTWKNPGVRPIISRLIGWCMEGSRQ